MLYGYARQSRKPKNGSSDSIEYQIAELRKAGCERIFHERKSGRKERAEFNKMMAEIRPGDGICVLRLSRLGRTSLQLIMLLDELRTREIYFLSLRQGIDTRNPTGKILYQLFSVLAENDVDQIQESSADLVAHGRERGRKGGRPAGLSEQAKKTAGMVQILYEQKQSIASIRAALNIGSNSTVFKYLRWAAGQKAEKV